jgi:predicted DNA-binding transcriptional regulator AlpA
MRQVALLIGVSEKTVARWLSLGQFPKPERNGACHPKWSYTAVEGFLCARRAKEAAHAS